MATVIAAIGGSLLRPEIEERHAWLEGLVSVIRDRVSMDDRIGIVVGGGAPAREGIELARPLIDNEGHLDKIGIAATRLNATIVREALSDGHTTDAVAIRFAIASGADRCIIATNVPKVYEEDPRENPEAESHDFLTHDRLQEIVGPAEHSRAGASQIVDPVGVSEANISKMTLNILDGRDVGLIRSAIVGDEFVGTVVRGA